MIEIRKTQKDLKEKRLKNFLPDPSFDLDGDGFVSFTDYAIAKHFDKDNDGKLNSEEKAAAVKALNENFKD